MTPVDEGRTSSGESPRSAAVSAQSRSAAPGFNVSLGRNFGRKCRIVRRFRQHGVHFSEPLADGGCDRSVIREFVGLPLCFILAGRKIFERAIELIERPGPGVALIADESLYDCERIALAGVRRVNHLTEKRWRVGEAVNGEIAAEFGLRMDAG
jgi:hypothetical protein